MAEKSRVGLPHPTYPVLPYPNPTYLILPSPTHPTPSLPILLCFLLPFYHILPRSTLDATTLHRMLRLPALSHGYHEELASYVRHPAYPCYDHTPSHG